MEGVQIISVSDLLLQSRPLTGTGTASLRSPTPSSPPFKKHKGHPSDEAPLPLPDYNPRPKTFSPLTRPAILIGTIHLPSEDPHQCCSGGPENHCLSFSDGSSSVCCAVLDFDVKIIGRTIHVLAWNFVPFNRTSGGLLEVICWSLPSSPDHLIPSHSPFQENPSIASSRSFSGALEAVSPVFWVPFRNRADPLQGTFGFLTEITSFTKQLFIYFLGSTSCWRPVLSQLVGNFITVSGLKEKMVFVGEDEPCLMFVTTVKTTVSVGSSVNEMKSNGGIYLGVVTAVYMECMVVELDEKVWLLITDPRLAPQHSLRVGALVSIRNFHLLRPNFSWTRMLLLGTCARTSINVQSFSLSDTRCYFRKQTQNLLEKFIESLLFSARFWVLLLVSCFRQKFARIFSYEEILGSKNQEGLVQIYARAYLSSSAFQHQHGIFMEFCKHGQYTCRNESTLGPVKLVPPISTFINKCEAIWVSVISQIQNSPEAFGVNNDGNYLSCEGTSCCTIRRIISSKELGFILMGTLKISPSSGRLQLVDATGSVDLVVPDLLSNIDGQSIHEVKDFKLVLEGLPTQQVSFGSRCGEPLSCKNIFQQFPYKKVENRVAVYLHYFLGDSTFLNVPPRLPSCIVRSADLGGGGGEVFHLLLVTHKFPIIENDGLNLLNSSSLFAEAWVLPYVLILSEEPECNKDSSKLIPQAVTVEGQEDFLEVERRPKQIPCLLTFRSNNIEKSSVPGHLCLTAGIALENLTCNQRILLEFKTGSFCKYQLLYPGVYYLLRCSKDGFLFNTKSCEEMDIGKALVDSQSTLLSLSFSSDCSSRVSSASKVCSDEVIFRQSLSKVHGTSDVQLHLSSKALGPVNKEVEAVEVLSVSSCIQMMAKLTRPFEAVDRRSRKLSQGNLISLRGNIENVHDYICKSTESYEKSERTDINQSKPCSKCLHVYDENHMVRIRGNFSKYTFPIGMGPGANATFHRVLMSCCSSKCSELLLTPVSYVIINSVKEYDHQHREKRSLSTFRYNILKENPFNTVSLALISQLTQCIDGTVVRFHSRVVTVNVLVFEREFQDFEKSQSRRQSKMPLAKIPLAGFVLSDGSSICCCWADAGTAETLLGLHEAAAYGTCTIRRGKRQKAVLESKRSGKTTVGHQLEKILKKHNRIIARNHGAVTRSSCRALNFSVDSDEVFSNAEERFLRRIVLNTCVGPTYNITGYTMNQNALNYLDPELVVPRRSMRNVWVGEVGLLNPLQVARDMIHELQPR